MKVTNLLIRPHNAIPSWEGYEYQGHIALFVALQKIRDEIVDNNKRDFSEFSIEIEGIEDFSIKQNDKYLSIHQVKAGGFSLEEKDKFCFIISVLQHDTKGFFHIIPAEKLPIDFVCITVNMIATLKNQFAHPIKNKNELADPKKSCDCIVVEYISGNSAKGDKYNILKFVMEQESLNHNKKDVESGINLVVQKLDHYNGILVDNNVSRSDDCYVALFSELFDSTSDVEEKSYSIIAEILNALDDSWIIGASSDDDRIKYCRSIYEQILVYAKKEITKSHELKHNNCKICIDKIYDLIDIDKTIEKGSIPYQYRMVWKTIKNRLKNTHKKMDAQMLFVWNAKGTHYVICTSNAKK